MKLKFQCCFCGEGIATDGNKFHALDPCALILVSNWEQAPSEQDEQQFFCHLECFKKTVESHAPIGIEEMGAEAQSS